MAPGEGSLSARVLCDGTRGVPWPLWDVLDGIADFPPRVVEPWSPASGWLIVVLRECVLVQVAGDLVAGVADLEHRLHRSADGHGRGASGSRSQQRATHPSLRWNSLGPAVRQRPSTKGLERRGLVVSGGKASSTPTSRRCGHHDADQGTLMSMKRFDPTTSPVVWSVALAPHPIADLSDKNLDARTDRLVVVIAPRGQPGTVRSGHAD